MLSHITLGTNDFGRVRTVYRPVTAALGIDQQFAMDGAIVFGALAGPKLFIVAPFDRASASVGNGAHAAFVAPARAAVDVFYATALAHGGSAAGPPRMAPALSSALLRSLCSRPG